MKIVVMLLCVLLITLPVLAGTFRDDFEDGNAEGYILTVGRPPADPEQSLIEVQNGLAGVFERKHTVSREPLI